MRSMYSCNDYDIHREREEKTTRLPDVTIIGIRRDKK